MLAAVGVLGVHVTSDLLTLFREFSVLVLFGPSLAIRGLDVCVFLFVRSPSPVGAI